MNKPSNIRGTDSSESMTKPNERTLELPKRVPITPRAEPRRIPPGTRAAVRRTSGIVWDVAIIEVHPGPCGTTISGILPSAPHKAHGLNRLKMVLDRNVEIMSMIGRTETMDTARSIRRRGVIYARIETCMPL